MTNVNMDDSTTTTTTATELPRSDSFSGFFQTWLHQQNQILNELVSVAKSERNGTVSSSAADDGEIIRLVDRVYRQYLQYYQTKAKWATRDVLAMLTPSWRTLLEDAFLWIGGWRPTLAVHLLYSKSGLQFQNTLFQNGGEASAAAIAAAAADADGDLGGLSSVQLRKVDEIQVDIVREEREITEKMARVQESAGNSRMVELAHESSEAMREDGGDESERDHRREGIEGKVAAEMKKKAAAMEEVLKKADELRMKVLKEILDVLTPMQSVHFLIAAAELHLRIHEWGNQDWINNKKEETHHPLGSEDGDADGDGDDGARGSSSSG